MTILPVGSFHIRGSEDLAENDISIITEMLNNNERLNLHIDENISADYLKTLLTPFVKSGKIRVIQFKASHKQEKRILRVVERIARTL